MEQEQLSLLHECKRFRSTAQLTSGRNWNRAMKIKQQQQQQQQQQQ